MRCFQSSNIFQYTKSVERLLCKNPASTYSKNCLTISPKNSSKNWRSKQISNEQIHFKRRQIFDDIPGCNYWSRCSSVFIAYWATMTANRSMISSRRTVQKTSGQFIYRLSQGENPNRAGTYWPCLSRIYVELFPRYQDIEVFKIFERVYIEHFTVINKKITLIETTALSTGSLQSPDDLDATYVKKNNTSYRGYVVQYCWDVQSGKSTECNHRHLCLCE